MLRRAAAAKRPRGDCFFAVTAVTAVTTLISISYFCNGAVWATRYARYTIDFATLFKKPMSRLNKHSWVRQQMTLCFVASGKPTRACRGSMVSKKILRRLDLQVLKSIKAPRLGCHIACEPRNVRTALLQQVTQGAR